MVSGLFFCKLVYVVKIFYFSHDVYRNGLSSESKNIPLFMIEKIFFGHAKNRHMKLVIGLKKFVIVFFSSFDPNIHISCYPCTSMKNNGETTYNMVRHIIVV